MVKNIALIFPRQGAQKVGMGLEFFQNSPQAKSIFEKADQIFTSVKKPNVFGVVGSCHCEEPEATKQSLTKVMFEGPEEKLTSTAYCQPAIFTMSVAALEAFRASSKFKDVSVKFTAGHSLGEYAALYAAGVLNFEDALRLVQKRASLMEEASKQSQGSMAAIIGFDTGKLIEICRQTGAEVANFNSHEQIVISGSTAKVQAAMEAIKAAGGQKIIPLTVSGAFHSSLMTPAAEGFAAALKNVTFQSPQVPTLSNVTGQPHFLNVISAKAGIQEFDQMRINLVAQIDHSVQWVQCVEYIAAQGITDFIEIGPGKVLKGLIRRINPAITVSNIEKPQDIEALGAP